jgi:hypothetical protein
MYFDFIPLWLFFAATVLFIVISIDIGFIFGKSKRLSMKGEKETAVSAISTAVLGLLSFFLVFCFDIAYEHYDAKKQLVGEEANLIRTVWQRADFLPEKNIAETRQLLKNYIDGRVAIAVSREFDSLQVFIKGSKEIQNSLWNTAVLNARKDMNSDVAALYIESLNELFNIEATRIDVAVRSRIPFNIWILLYVIVFLGMFSLGYLTAIAQSVRRSWTMIIMVLSFSLIILLIAALDRPESQFVNISQGPLKDLRAWMDNIKEVPIIHMDTTGIPALELFK